MKKIRGRTIGVFLVAALSGAALLHISQNVQQAEDDLARAKLSYESQQEMIRVLDVEWAYLNSPGRLEVLAREYLDVQAPGAGQMMPGQIALPVGDIPPEIGASRIEGDGVSSLVHNISQSSGEVSGVVRGVPAPGRKPKSQKGDFGALLNGLGKGATQ